MPKHVCNIMSSSTICSLQGPNSWSKGKLLSWVNQGQASYLRSYESCLNYQDVDITLGGTYSYQAVAKTP